MLARLREEGKDGKQMSQALYDTFWEDMERRVHAEGVRRPSPDASCTRRRACVYPVLAYTRRAIEIVLQ